MSDGDVDTDAPFRGVPLLLKDFLIQTQGDPYYAGMRYLRDLKWRSTHDTYLAQKFRAAGFKFPRQDQFARVGGRRND